MVTHNNDEQMVYPHTSLIPTLNEQQQIQIPDIEDIGKPAQCTYQPPRVVGLSHKLTRHSQKYRPKSWLRFTHCFDVTPLHVRNNGFIYFMTFCFLSFLFFVLISSLNGNNGEATNGDDLDMQDRVRANREAHNHRHRVNPDAPHRPPTFNSLNERYIEARKVVMKAWRDKDPLIDDYRNNERLLRNEIIENFPLRSVDVLPLLQPAPVVQEVVTHTNVRLYIMATSGNYRFVMVTILLCSFALLLIALGIYLMSFAKQQIEFVIVPNLCYMIAAALLFIAASKGCKYAVTGTGGITPTFVGDSNRAIDIDPEFQRMVVVPNTFWCVKGYTHYIDIPLPSEYLQRTDGSAWQVVSGCSTDSQLANIAYVTMARSQPLMRYFEANQQRLPRSHEFYCRYASMFVAQQHMYHLYQTSLMSARGGKITLDSWTGSELNFRYGGRIHGVIETGCFRQSFEDSQSTDQWVDNGRFHIASSTCSGVTRRWASSEGVYTPEAWRKDIGFKETDHINLKRLRRYRTKLMTYHNGGVLYARTNTNLYSALNRMFTARENNPSLEKELVDAQHRNVKLGYRRYGKLLFNIAEVIKRKFDTNCDVDDLIGQLKLIQETHPKKKLREEAFEYIQKMTLIKSKCYATKVTAKVKIEVAKFLKNARVYVDMTTPQSLLGGWLVNPLKDAMKDVDLGWCAFKFAKSTDEETMSQCFTFLRDNSHRPVCVYHSDDAVMQLPCSDGVLRFDLDISSCDRSNTAPIFELLLDFIPDGPWKFLYERMIQGCSLNLVIPNPSVKGDYIKAKPLQPFEYSGCNLTTVLNNAALLVIAASIFHKFKKNMTREQASLLVPKCAKSVGYLVTVKVCDNFERVQFLKYSPSDIVNCYPVRNLGCVLRAVGHFDGDLPGKGPIAARAQEHISQVVTGITTGYIDTVSHILRDKFRSNKPLSNKYQWEVAKFVHSVPDTFLFRRYGLDEYQVEMLKELVYDAGVGDYVTSPILDTIFRIDYG